MRLLPLLLLAVPLAGFAAGNTTNESFNDAKRTLERHVYYDHRVTLYCEATFDAKKNITLPAGFTTPKHEKRATRVEWEHVVPAENFGRSFVEWREGDAICTDKKGRAYKGRKCAERANVDFRLMHADMYNLYPAIGAVNAMRSNKNFALLPHARSAFGTCPMKIEKNRVEPPESARGVIARTYLYMAESYPAHMKLSKQQERLMQAWDNQYPVTAWECKRARRIEGIQGNSNAFVKDACLAKNLWH